MSSSSFVRKKKKEKTARGEKSDSKNRKRPQGKKTNLNSLCRKESLLVRHAFKEEQKKQKKEQIKGGKEHPPEKTPARRTRKYKGGKQRSILQAPNATTGGRIVNIKKRALSGTPRKRGRRENSASRSWNLRENTRGEENIYREGKKGGRRRLSHQS